MVPWQDDVAVAVWLAGICLAGMSLLLAGLLWHHKRGLPG